MHILTEIVSFYINLSIFRPSLDWLYCWAG